MTTSSISRRNFLVTGTALAASPILKGEEPTGPAATRATANEFLSKWIQAWNHHAANQLGSLQTSDATPSTASVRWSRDAQRLRRPLASCTTPADHIMTSPRRPCN